jgi:hypothetical protein
VVKDQADLQVWYETNCMPFLMGTASAYELELLLKGAEVSVNAVAGRAVAQVIEQVSTGQAMTLLFAVNKEESKADEAKAAAAEIVQAAEANRRRSLGPGEASSASASGANTTTDPVLESVVNKQLLEPLLEQLKRRRAELFACILQAVKDLRLQWQPGSEVIPMTNIARRVEPNDAGGLWLAVCRECFLPHPLLTADRALVNAHYDDRSLEYRRELVRSLFEREKLRAAEGLQGFAERLVWWRHAYDQVDMEFSAEKVKQRISSLLREESDTVVGIWRM